MEYLQNLLLSNYPLNSYKLPELITTTENKNFVNLETGTKTKKKLKILIAGGGIGGLVLALGAKKRGFEVQVFEKSLSTTRGEGRHRGPIQLQTSALAALQAIDEDVAREIMEAGSATGDRICGLADGLSGEWFAKLDLLTPALERGLPVTRVVCRMTLQDILVKALGLDILHNTSKVVDFREDSDKVTVVLDNGQQYEGDVLIVADGIWSKVRTKLVGWDEAQYSNYTCYSGVAEYVPPYINTVGYRVFLGLKKYFVALDIGDGRMQWYGFHKQPSQDTDAAIGKKHRLLELFGGWCSEVTTLILETPEDMILQRDIYDRDMIYSWGKGRVTLLGDAAHPLQPTFGQGGCMAIEDCYELLLNLEKVAESSSNTLLSEEIFSALKRYEKKRIFRVGMVHTVTRMASEMITYYQPYIDFGSGPLSFLTTMRIKNPAIHPARYFLQLGMALIFTWMLVGTA